MQTTLRDYSRFGRAVLNSELLDQKSKSQFLSPQVPILSEHEFPSLDLETTAENEPIRLSYGPGRGLLYAACMGRLQASTGQLSVSLLPLGNLKRFHLDHGRMTGRPESIPKWRKQPNRSRSFSKMMA
jgi:hypothetical protein